MNSLCTITKAALVAVLLYATGVFADTQNLVPVVPLAPATAVVTTSSAQAVAANNVRRGIACVNTGSNNIYLAYGTNAAVVGYGIELNANGGAWTANDYTFTLLAINAIASGGSSTLSCQEYD